VSIRGRRRQGEKPVGYPLPANGSSCQGQSARVARPRRLTRQRRTLPQATFDGHDARLRWSEQRLTRIPARSSCVFRARNGTAERERQSRPRQATVLGFGRTPHHGQANESVSSTRRYATLTLALERASCSASTAIGRPRTGLVAARQLPG